MTSWSRLRRIAESSPSRFHSRFSCGLFTAGRMGLSTMNCNICPGASLISKRNTIPLIRFANDCKVWMILIYDKPRPIRIPLLFHRTYDHELPAILRSNFCDCIHKTCQRTLRVDRSAAE